MTWHYCVVAEKQSVVYITFTHSAADWYYRLVWY